MTTPQRNRSSPIALLCCPLLSHNPTLFLLFTFYLPLFSHLPARALIFSSSLVQLLFPAACSDSASELYWSFLLIHLRQRSSPLRSFPLDTSSHEPRSCADGEKDEAVLEWECGTWQHRPWTCRPPTWGSSGASAAEELHLPDHLHLLLSCLAHQHCGPGVLYDGRAAWFMWVELSTMG